MTLDNIQLPSIVVSNLYKKSLVDLNNDELLHAKESNEISFLGGNKQQILFLINYAGMAFLPDRELQFLSGILSACKLSLGDIAIINLDKFKTADQKNLPELLNAEIVILSGIKNKALDLPFNIPEFQIQSFKNRKYLFTPALEVIQNDMDLKRKLWETLKKLFNL